MESMVSQNHKKHNTKTVEFVKRSEPTDKIFDTDTTIFK